ncbi:MAG: SAM-dependent methyltransferase [Alphaproteobacteria bacterium]|nr:MAG: SAM-dependent methyltransferase [Alphaproteobacteria bacterium]
MAVFKDHFSKQSEGYSKFRPLYPPELYGHLSDICGAHALVWDCATGSGQAARGLAEYFDHIVATDASEQQIASAAGPDNVSFSVATAEQSGLHPSSVDLITVAQALHWFDHGVFFQEVRRVLKPGGVLAAWTYNLLKIDEDIDPVLQRFDRDIVGAYWPPERQLVRDEYGTMDFPFDEIPMPAFNMVTLWTLDDLLGYLASWSSVVCYQKAKGRDPLTDIHAELGELWGPAADKKPVTWPLSFRVGRL